MKKKFTFIDAGYPGSAHDIRVFKNTELYNRLTNDPDSVLKSNNNHLIGDSGFQLAPYMLVPYKDYGNLNRIQRKYNRKLSQTRYVIENTFCLLKQRFRRLKCLDVKVKRMPDIIIACCVVHNITMQFAEEEAALLAEGLEIPRTVHDPLLPNLPAVLGGDYKRDYIAAIM